MAKERERIIDALGDWYHSDGGTLAEQIELLRTALYKSELKLQESQPLPPLISSSPFGSSESSSPFGSGFALGRSDRRQAILAKVIMDVMIWLLRDGNMSAHDVHCGRAWWALVEEFGIPDDPQRQYDIGVPRPSR